MWPFDEGMEVSSNGLGHMHQDHHRLLNHNFLFPVVNRVIDILELQKGD